MPIPIVKMTVSACECDLLTSSTNKTMPMNQPAQESYPNTTKRAQGVLEDAVYIATADTLCCQIHRSPSEQDPYKYFWHNSEVPFMYKIPAVPCSLCIPQDARLPAARLRLGSSSPSSVTTRVTRSMSLIYKKLHLKKSSTVTANIEIAPGICTSHFEALNRFNVEKSFDCATSL
jgi:hypothetical protein